MIKVKKRGKGKIKDVIGNEELYKFYKTNSKKPVDQKTFNSLIKDLNNKIIDKIILESEEFKMPFRLGNLRINKFEQQLHNRPKNKWPVDYVKSKELGFIVYYEHDYVYRWKWFKNKALVKWKSIYCFKPSRASKRYLAHAIKNLKKDYFS